MISAFELGHWVHGWILAVRGRVSVDFGSCIQRRTPCIEIFKPFHSGRCMLADLSIRRARLHEQTVLAMCVPPRLGYFDVGVLRSLWRILHFQVVSYRF